MRQAELAFRSWGGARRGAGRKPKGERPLVPHDTRPAHHARFPVLITTRLRAGLPSLRRADEAGCIRAAISSTQLVAPASALANGRGRRAPPFQVVHYSIQSNHLHLIVESTDRSALTAGLRGLLVRIARALNRQWKRCGSVFGDRFHERVLHNPRQVRNALVYVLQNVRKHGVQMYGPDPYSSGPEFEGWSRSGPTGAVPIQPPSLDCRPQRRPVHVAAASRGGVGSRALLSVLRAARTEIPSPSTWLLGVGWQRHGLIDPDEGPIAR